jgi:hypothetical protein
MVVFEGPGVKIGGEGRLTFLMLWATILFAGDFWAETPFYRWSDQEVDRMLTNSPWARKAKVYVKGKDSGAALIVRWQTAVPIRQAVARFHYGDQAGTLDKVAKQLNRDEAYYIVGIVGLPLTLAGKKPEGLKSWVTLKAGSQPPTRPVDILTAELMSPALNVFFFFPKAQSGAHVITLADEAAEFSLKTPLVQIRRTFVLKELVYNGKLEL